MHGVPIILESLFPFLLIVLVMELTPGPNMGYLAMIAAYHGRKTGLSAVAGVALGLALLGFIAALGLATLVQTYPVLRHALRWLGVAYLLWIAWDSWRTSAMLQRQTKEKHFIRGLITNLLNPKAFLFYVTVVPRFVPEGEEPFRWMLGLAMVEVVIATLIHIGIVVLASGAEHYLRDEKREQVTRRMMALSLIAIAFWLAFETR